MVCEDVLEDGEVCEVCVGVCVCEGGDGDGKGVSGLVASAREANARGGV